MNESVRDLAEKMNSFTSPGSPGRAGFIWAAAANQFDSECTYMLNPGMKREAVVQKLKQVKIVLATHGSAGANTKAGGAIGTLFNAFDRICHDEMQIRGQGDQAVVTSQMKKGHHVLFIGDPRQVLSRPPTSVDLDEAVKMAAS